MSIQSGDTWTCFCSSCGALLSEYRHNITEKARNISIVYYTIVADNNALCQPPHNSHICQGRLAGNLCQNTVQCNGLRYTLVVKRQSLKLKLKCMHTPILYQVMKVYCQSVVAVNIQCVVRASDNMHKMTPHSTVVFIQILGVYAFAISLSEKC